MNTQNLTKIIFILLIIAIVLPMLFLLTVVIGEITTTVAGEQENPSIFAQFSSLIAALWFFDLVLIVITLAMKELVGRGIMDSSTDDELLDEEYNRFVNKE